MAQVPYLDLLPEVLAAAPACPSPTIVRAVRNAARELCEDADCYRIFLENTVLVANQSEVELSLPEDTTLHRPISLTVGGTRLQPYSVTMLDKDDGEWRSESGDPLYWMRSQDNLNAIVLAPKPASTISANALTGEIAIKPSRDSTGIEEVFMDRFQSAVVDGAIANLLQVPSAPWYSPDIAGYHKGMFEAAKDQARALADGDDTPKLRKIRYGGI